MEINLLNIQKHLCALAKHSGFFDKILSLGPENLDNNFKKNYKDILSETKVVIGFGNSNYK